MNECVYWVCARTGISTLFLSQWIPLMSELACRGPPLWEVGVSAPIIRSDGLSPVVWLARTHGEARGPPESSLESSASKPLLRKCFRHTWPNLKTKGLLGCHTSLVLHGPAPSTDRRLHKTTELGEALHVCIWMHARLQETTISGGKIWLDSSIYRWLVLVKSFSLSESHFPHVEMGMKYFAESLWLLHTVNVKLSGQRHGKL